MRRKKDKHWRKCDVLTCHWVRNIMHVHDIMCVYTSNMCKQTKIQWKKNQRDSVAWPYMNTHTLGTCNDMYMLQWGYVNNDMHIVVVSSHRGNDRTSTNVFEHRQNTIEHRQSMFQRNKCRCSIVLMFQRELSMYRRRHCSSADHACFFHLFLLFRFLFRCRDALQPSPG